MGNPEVGTPGTGDQCFFSARRAERRKSHEQGTLHSSIFTHHASRITNDLVWYTIAASISDGENGSPVTITAKVTAPEGTSYYGQWSDTGPSAWTGTGTVGIAQYSQWSQAGEFDNFTVDDEVTLFTPPVVSIEAEASTVVEGETITYTVSRTGGDQSQALTVFLDTPTGTATPSSDYGTIPSSVTIPASESSVTFGVNTIGDSAYEPDETLVVGVASNASYAFGSSPAEVTIQDDDVPAPAMISFTGDGLDGLLLKNYYTDLNGNNVRDAGEPLGDTPFRGPEYDRATGRNKWVAEQVGILFHVQATFDLSGLGDTFAGPAYAWATASDAMLDLGSADAPILLMRVGNETDTWTGVFQIASAPSQIDVVDTTWNWHVTDGGGVVDYQSHTTHTLMFSLGGDDDHALPGGHDYSTPVYDDGDVAFSGGTVTDAQSIQAAAVPTTQRTDADIQKWSSTVAKDLRGDENILSAMIKRENLAKIGDYTVPFTSPEGNPFDGFSKETLVAYHMGTCGNWADFFAEAAARQKIIVTRNGFLTRQRAPAAGVNDWAEGFTTQPLTGIGVAPKTYDFSDHEWVEYGDNRTIYDPSFASTYKLADAPNGTTAAQLWRQYLMVQIIDLSRFWIRKPDSLPDNPWQVIADKANLTKEIQVAAGNANYAFFTFSDRWHREHLGQKIPPAGDMDLAIRLANPPG